MTQDHGSTPSLIEGFDAEDRQRVESLSADLEELRQEADSSVPVPSFDEAFLARLVASGSAYATLPRKFLAECGLALQEPDRLEDDELSHELWRAIWAMALLRLLLDHTDHLSDRQLYEHIYDELLTDPTSFKPGEPETPLYVCDLLLGVDEEECRLLLTYYSDRLDDDRRQQITDRLEGEPPEPLPRPYDRDRFLP